MKHLNKNISPLFYECKVTHTLQIKKLLVFSVVEINPILTSK